MNQIGDRLCAEHLAEFPLMNPKNFSNFARQFPRHLLATVSKFYPMINVGKLENELRCIYTNQTFSNIASAYALNRFLGDNTLTTTFTASAQFLDIILTTPISSAEAERTFSTLKRIKTYLRNTMKQDRLNSLAVLSIRKDVISDMHDFNQRVIEHFASKKSRRAEYMFKR